MMTRVLFVLKCYASTKETINMQLIEEKAGDMEPVPGIGKSRSITCFAYMLLAVN